MNIRGIGVSPAFGDLGLTKKGAAVLAEEFVKNPELEGKFMVEIAKPLEDTETTDVVFDGYQARVLVRGKEKESMSVIHGYNSERHYLGTVAKYGCRMAQPKQSNLEPTYVFSSHYPLNEIEIAKNIALDIDKAKLNKEADKLPERFKNESVEEKSKRLYKRFQINA